ncbi:MAG: sigma-70 family RNA polymerase sigma factor [Agathobacter sp.]|nr:sigma-70 family RNA polymerase sigma factor [Agathobacter sp.]
MEDKQIIDLYFQRNETAIAETSAKYGAFCHKIAMNILSIHEDAEECVNDTYLHVWNQIPPTNPCSFRAFLGRITRNISISRFRALRAKKRYNGVELMLSELEECVPASSNVEQTIEAKELSSYINAWLYLQSEKDTVLFIRRYWYGDSVQDLAKKSGTTATKMAQTMLRLRKSLKAYLEQKGVTL